MWCPLLASVGTTRAWMSRFFSTPCQILFSPGNALDCSLHLCGVHSCSAGKRCVGGLALLEIVFHLYTVFVSFPVLLFHLSTVFSQFLIILWPFLVLVLKCWFLLFLIYFNVFILHAQVCWIQGLGAIILSVVDSLWRNSVSNLSTKAFVCLVCFFEFCFLQFSIRYLIVTEFKISSCPSGFMILIHLVKTKQYLFEGWRDGSAFKSTVCFSRGPSSLTVICNSCPRGPSVLVLWALDTQVARRRMFRQNTHAHKSGNWVLKKPTLKPINGVGGKVVTKLKSVHITRSRLLALNASW